MSADRDRGIRRQKQKRAKTTKRERRERLQTAPTANKPASTAAQPAAQ